MPRSAGGPDATPTGRPSRLTIAQGRGLPGKAAAILSSWLRGPACSIATRASLWLYNPCLNGTAAICASATAGNAPSEAASTYKPWPSARTLPDVTPNAPLARNASALLNKPAGPPFNHSTTRVGRSRGDAKASKEPSANAPAAARPAFSRLRREGEWVGISMAGSGGSRCGVRRSGHRRKLALSIHRTAAILCRESDSQRSAPPRGR